MSKDILYIFYVLTFNVKIADDLLQFDHKTYLVDVKNK